MKTTKNSVNYLSLSLVCLMLVSQASYAGIAGYAQFVRGSVQLASVTGQTSTLKKGAAVNEGDTVITERGANAQIKMQDGGFVAVRPDTQLKFDSFKFNGKEDGSENLVFSLVKGGFRSVTGLIGRINKPSYRITTAAATIGIRGTDHETFVVLPESLLANTAPAGTYNKVNVGETFIATDVGTIFVMPNQMGYAGSANQMPELRPVNADLFTVAEKPTKDAKSDEDEESEEVRETADVDSTAEENTAPETDVAESTLKDINSTILQPIKDESGTDLTGGDSTPTPTPTPTPVVAAAYDPKNILINFASIMFSGSDNYSVLPANITYDISGAPTSFTAGEILGLSSSSFSVIGGTGPILGTATSGTTGIEFGRWTGITGIEQTYTASLGNSDWRSVNSWMYGAQGYLDVGYGFIGAVTGAMAGTFNYTLDGKTAPLDRQSGQSGTLTSASISVDFVNSLLNINLALNVGGQAWTASATGVALSGPEFYSDSGTLVVATGLGTAVTCPNCGGVLNGAFTGQNYAGAILSYNLWNNGSGGGDVSGLASFVRPLMNVAGASVVDSTTLNPTGLYEVATSGGDNKGSIQFADLLTTTGGVLTAYSFGTPAQGYYWSTTVTCTTCTVAPTTANTPKTGIYYGTWDAGSYTNTYGQNFGSSSTWGPIMISGPESGPLYLANALVGTKTFSFDGGMVVNANGVPGSVLNTTTLTVDFTRQVIGVNLELSVPDTQPTPSVHTWLAYTAAGNELLFQDNGIGGATFRSWSVNGGAGPGTLTLTVDGAAPISSWGNLNGQLTGIGFNGAILSYDFAAQLPASVLFEQVSGVAALSNTASNVATPYRTVMISVTDPDSIITLPVIGFYANAPTRMLTNGAGNLTQFDMSTINTNNSGSLTLSSGTSVLANAGSDPLTGISWGRWDGGSINGTQRSDGVTTATPLRGSLHWIAAQTETAPVTLPVSGTYTYINAGGTAPTDNLGNVGTLNSATLNANFTAQTVDVGVNVTVAGANLIASAVGTPILQQTAFYANSQVVGAPHLTVTCAGTCGTSTQGAIFGEFTGAGAIGAMMTYGLQNVSASSTQSVSGVVAFHR